MKTTWPKWAIGPFKKHPGNPVLSPSEKGFDSWAAYNAAVVVHDDLFHMYYRAESRDEADTPYCGTSRIGLAVSTDGLAWTRPFVAPLLDATEAWEIPGGCEDPRIVRVGDAWHLLYTGYCWPKGVVLCDAISTDLLRWEKRGPVFPRETLGGMQSKSACPVCDPAGNAVKIDGRYVMYTNDQLAFSDDFEHWKVEPLRAAAFSGRLNEVCVAVTDHRVPGRDDIVLFVAGTLDRIPGAGDRFYAVGETLMSRRDPRERLDVLPGAVLAAEHPFERSADRLSMVADAGKGCIFLCSLFRHGGRWWLYYGAADQYVGLATAPA
jgi:predicted GH43/DUF377 family glycosyl hydrolase